VVIGVTNFGLFVELTDVYVEGLVHVTALTNDYYHFDSVSHTLTGERSGLCFRLGDQVRVVVSRVDLDERKIELQLLSGGTAGQGAGRGLHQRERRKDKQSGKRGGQYGTRERRGGDNKSAGRRSRRR